MLRKPLRTGLINGWWMAFLASVLVLGGLIALLAWDPDSRPTPAGQEPLLVYCAAGIRVPVEAAAQEYQEAYGIPVQLQFQGSETLLANIEVSRRGDLYLPADDSYAQKARKKDLIDETIPLAQMTPVLAVRAGNPRKLHGLDDLLRADVGFALANPEAAAVGRLTRDNLSPEQWQKLEKRNRVFKPTVNDVANDIKLGTVDAGIVWDATVRQYPELEAVPLPELARTTAHITICVLRSSEQPTAALRFARFLAARDRGLPQFEKAGFRPVEGDVWAETPELHLLAGAMLRPAIEETIERFEKREGVKVTRVYNGCGILVAQMRTGQHPDAYFACDKSFMDQVTDLFDEPFEVSTNQLVILVPKGNPRGIRSLKDLGQPGLQIGIGHEKQCALGALTQRTLEQGGFQAAVMKNVAVQAPTGDLLVNNLRAGSLDAVIAYISNATSSGDLLEAIPIDIPCAVAIQPIAVGKDSAQKQLSQRLMDTLRSRDSQRRFESSGFHWKTPSR